jgi:glycosyltransferase involved in cell wall biosynthesis
MYRAELLGARAAWRAGTPAAVATVHSSRVRSPSDVAALASLTPLFNRLIVPSEAIAAKVRREGRGAAPVSVIPNGVDLDRFATPRAAGERAEARATTRAALGVAVDAFLVGVVARLEPEKGHRHLLAAWPEIAEAVPNAWLLVVGDGSLTLSLHAQARALPADAARRVAFAGARDDVPALTRALDLAVLPSLREAQGIALLEAMAARLPVVASAVGGIPEMVRHDVEGLLVPSADPDAMSAAVRRLAGDPALRQRLGNAGRRRAAARYAIGSAVSRIEAVYDDALGPAIAQAGGRVS